jgi:hypothetical protein
MSRKFICKELLNMSPYIVRKIETLFPSLEQYLEFFTVFSGIKIFMHVFHNFSQNLEGNIGRTEMWMTDEFMKDWLAVVCKQRARGASEKMGDVGVRCI